MVTVLVVSNEQDLGADHVVLELGRRGVSVLRCNSERLPQWDVDLRPGESWSLRSPSGRRATSGEVTGVWWRRPEPPRYSVVSSGSERKMLVDQWQAFAQGLATVPGPRWVSMPSAISAAEDKATQLMAARGLGFHVPETVWTNDLSNAESFVDSNPAVIKTVTAAHWEDDSEAAFVFAHPVALSELPTDKGAFGAAPVALQARIDRKVDVRVTVAGSRVIAAGAQACAHLDWRLEDDIEWVPHALPHDVADRSHQLVRELGLAFGALDLAQDEDERYWFLEINPNGEWGWLQTRGLPIASAIADTLVDDAEPLA
jgi:hypothetical protein